MRWLGVPTLNNSVQVGLQSYKGKMYRARNCPIYTCIGLQVRRPSLFGGILAAGTWSKLFALLWFTRKQLWQVPRFFGLAKACDRKPLHLLHYQISRPPTLR